MKLEINTTEKSITILDDTSILELINFLREKELEEYKIKSISKYEIVDKYIEYIPTNIQPYLNSPYIVTCSTNNYEVNTD